MTHSLANYKHLAHADYTLSSSKCQRGGRKRLVLLVGKSNETRNQERQIIKNNDDDEIFSDIMAGIAAHYVGAIYTL